MSYRGYGEIMAKCPYFSSESKYGIMCEGIIKNTKIVNKFSDENAKCDYVKEKCCHYPNTCTISQTKDLQIRC